MDPKIHLFMPGLVTSTVGSFNPVGPVNKSTAVYWVLTGIRLFNIAINIEFSRVDLVQTFSVFYCLALDESVLLLENYIHT